MMLVCPECGQIHVDEGALAERPHRIHTCVRGPYGVGCGATWHSPEECVGTDEIGDAFDRGVLASKVAIEVLRVTLVDALALIQSQVGLGVTRDQCRRIARIRDVLDETPVDDDDDSDDDSGAMLVASADNANRLPVDTTMRDRLRAFCNTAPIHQQWSSKCTTCGGNILVRFNGNDHPDGQLSFEHDDPLCAEFEDGDALPKLMAMLVDGKLEKLASTLS